MLFDKLNSNRNFSSMMPVSNSTLVVMEVNLLASSFSYGKSISHRFFTCRDDQVLSAFDLSFKKVAEVSEIPLGKMKVVKMKDKDILISNVNGSYYAIDGLCTHDAGDLSKGSLVDNIVACPVCGSKFDVISGKNLSVPKSWFSTAKAKDCSKYEVRIKDNDILVYQRSSWGM